MSLIPQRSLDLSETLFKNGAANYLTVLTAQTGLYDAQQISRNPVPTLPT